MKYAKLFTPVKVGSITIKNRFAMGPMGPLGLSDRGRLESERY